MKTSADTNEIPELDSILANIADYTVGYDGYSEEALQTSHYCLLDSIACALMAQKKEACLRHLGPIVDGATLANGARVPGTSHVLDPVQAAYNIGVAIRWLDFNDTWLAAEWGHPSDNLGAILAIIDWQTRAKNKKFSLADIHRAAIRAHEIQGVLALENSFNRVGLDHVLLVRVASAAVTAGLLGMSTEKVADTVSHAFLDGGALRTYRHAPNTGPRKSWAAGDATARALRLALTVEKGEPGYLSPLTAKGWGFQDVLFGKKEITLGRELGCYVMENVLFKISFPAEFHAQTAVEAAVTLHSQVADRIDEIAEVRIETQESAVRIISKTGELRNYADRDHCLQYMAAVGLIFGELKDEHYDDAIAADPRIDALREKMIVTENVDYSRDYLDADKRSIANSIQVKFADGSETEKITVEYPIGHRRRREEGIPVLLEKYRKALVDHFGADRGEEIYSKTVDVSPDTSASEFIGLFSTAA